MVDMQSDGFDSSRFLTAIDENFKCVIYPQVLRDPRQCSNKHLYCNNCIKDSVEYGKKCPMCRTSLIFSTLAHHDHFQRLNYNKMALRCKSDDCQAFLNPSDMFNHERDCPLVVNGVQIDVLAARNRELIESVNILNKTVTEQRCKLASMATKIIDDSRKSRELEKLRNHGDSSSFPIKVTLANYETIKMNVSPSNTIATLKILIFEAKEIPDDVQDVRLGFLPVADKATMASSGRAYPFLFQTSALEYFNCITIGFMHLIKFSNKR